MVPWAPSRTPGLIEGGLLAVSSRMRALRCRYRRDSDRPGRDMRTCTRRRSSQVRSTTISWRAGGLKGICIGRDMRRTHASHSQITLRTCDTRCTDNQTIGGGPGIKSTYVSFWVQVNDSISYRIVSYRLDSTALLSVGLVFVFVITDVVCEPACMAKLPTALAGKEVVAISQPTNQQSINSLICGSPRLDCAVNHHRAYGSGADPGSWQSACR